MDAIETALRALANAVLGAGRETRDEYELAGPSKGA